MSDSPASFSVPDTRLAAFGSKDEYLAFKSAWKALTSSRTPLPASFYAAHAVLVGRDVYKAFSPSKRPHDKDQPYRALVSALEHLGYLKGAWRFELRLGKLTEPQGKALHEALVRAAELVEPVNLANYAVRKAVATGAGQIPRASARVQTVEA